jgi:hypothetical protein
MNENYPHQILLDKQIKEMREEKFTQNAWVNKAQAA